MRVVGAGDGEPVGLELGEGVVGTSGAEQKTPVGGVEDAALRTSVNWALLKNSTDRRMQLRPAVS